MLWIGRKLKRRTPTASVRHCTASYSGGEGKAGWGKRDDSNIRLGLMGISPRGNNKVVLFNIPLFIINVYIML
jgi:hypothetical protein